ncbi:AMP-dependent synthetase and ligase [Thelephora ganbajun]|uniref:AMP-dependent synthetase and ligase n=1 Tax=Thelephora ganbajun TaxID=370292 RepID=A0ACB6ZNY2_THEGA|nr:AMP-dependent synthetase and ligase [Thelephora ganbajun]
MKPLTPRFPTVDRNGFVPAPESIPPPDVKYRQKVPPGLPVHKHPLNPLAFLLRGALIYPDHIAIAHPDVKHPAYYTYSVWAQRVQNLAYALIHFGIKPRDTVAVLAPNAPMIADAYQAIPAARGVICPINTRLTPLEIAYILEHSRAKLILVDYEYVHLVKDTKIPAILSNDTGRAGDPYEEFLSQGRRFSRERGWWGLEPEPDEDAGFALCYTSGTTGRPKGVLTTLRGTYLGAVANAYETKMDINSVYLWVLPMFHAGGWTYPWAATFAVSAQITLRNVSYPLIWNHLRNSSVTHYCGAPTVQIGLVNYPETEKLLKPVTAIIAGSAPTAHLIASLEKIGINPVHTYGPFTRNHLQESWLALPLEERAKHMARQGYSYTTADGVRVVYQTEDEDLQDVPQDGKTIGEIVVRGNLVMREYFTDEKATEKAFKGGYFRSGDLAVMYPDGSVGIQDRSKDIIISGGENASSLAIEQELVTHPDVLEVAVVARGHPKWGERPMAFVTLHPSKTAKWENKHKEFEIDLKAHARKRLPGFATPEWVAVVPGLPKTSTGKIQKVELRKRVAKL